MYEAFYCLREKPFSLTPDPRYLYLSGSHREALDHLLYGVREREGFVVITGDVGTGKTTMCRALLARLDPRTRTALVLNPMLSEEELLRTVLHDFGLPAAGPTRTALLDELNAFLVQALVDGHRAVLIIDESQDLSPRLLEQIRLLSNLETEREKLLQIILVGQLGLLDLLASPELRQLDQRVSIRYQIRPLDYRETCEYVHHRLTVAGGAGAVRLAPAALRAIHRFSGGVPRLINLAADRALLQGFVDQSPDITPRRVRQAIASLGHEARPRRRPAHRRQRALAAALVAAGFVAGWLAASGPIERVVLRRSTPVAGAAVTPAPDVPAVSPAASTPPAASAPPATSTPALASAPTAADSRAFTVLVGTYASEETARGVQRTLTGRGEDAFVALRAIADRPPTYGVLVGRFAQADDARGVVERLRAQAFTDSRVVRLADDATAAAP
jgi:general secretion pathway protein A